MRVRKAFVVGLFFGFLFCFSYLAYSWALDTQSASNLETLVVTATKIPTPVKEVPARVDVITQSEIRKSHARDLSELLIQKFPTHFHRYPGSLTALDIRGFRTDTHGTDIKGRVLVLIDGHRAGTGNIAAIPLENVERIEIVHGPASVVYGSAAMGGVVNIITKQGRGKPSVDAGFEYGSWSRLKGDATISGGFFQDKLGFSLSGRTVRQSGDYSDGDGDTVNNTEYYDEAYSVSFTARPTKNHTFNFVGQYFRAWDVGNPGPSYSPDGDNYKSILRRYFSGAYDGKLPSYNVSWHLSGYSVYDRSSWNDPAQAWGYLSSVTETETTGIRGHVQIPTFSWGSLLVGSDWDHIEVESWKKPTGAPWTPDTSYDNYAFFVEEKVSPTDRLNLYVGLRYDVFDESIEETVGLNVKPDDETFDHVSWRAGATYYVNEWLSARAAVGTAFRVPTADELAGRYEGAWTKIIGNPDLDPEKSITYEVGLDAARSNANFGLSIFYTDYSDHIVGGFQTCVDGDCTWTTYKNLDGATYVGLEGYASYTHSLSVGSHQLKITPYVNWIYYFVRDIDDDDDSRISIDTVPYVAEANLIAGLKFAFDTLADLTLEANYHGNQKIKNWNFLSPDYGKFVDKGGFTTYSLRLNLYPFEHFSPYLTIENLTDKDYSFVDGYPMPGITITGGFRLLF